MTEAEFSAYWKLLCECKNRAPSAPLTRTYALIVHSEGVTAEQWAKACTAAIRFEEFMPTPQRLIDLAFGHDFKAQALAEWDTCLDRVSCGEVATLPNTLTRTLLNRATNGTPLGHVDSNRLEWIKREFIERYAAALTVQAQKRTPALTGGAPKELTDAAD